MPSTTQRTITTTTRPTTTRPSGPPGMQDKYGAAASGKMDTKMTSDQLQQKLAQMVVIIGDVSKEIRNVDGCRHRDIVKMPHSHTYEKKILELESENNKLLEQLKDVIAMNTRWQLYDGQREDHVAQLNLKLIALQKQLDELCAQEAAGAVGKDNVDLAEESNKDKIQALEYQVKTSQEDFELERNDRARVQGQLQQLKERFEEAERDNKQQKDLIFFYQAQLGELRRGFDEPDLRARYLRNINKPRYRHYQSRYPGGLSGDVEVDGVVNDFDEVDSSGTNIQKLFVGNVLSDEVEIDGDVADDETDGGAVELLCPKCSKHFAYSEHDRLVEHMDRC